MAVNGTTAANLRYRRLDGGSVVKIHLPIGVAAVFLARSLTYFSITPPPKAIVSTDQTCRRDNGHYVFYGVDPSLYCVGRVVFSKER